MSAGAHSLRQLAPLTPEEFALAPGEENAKGFGEHTQVK